MFLYVYQTSAIEYGEANFSYCFVHYHMGPVFRGKTADARKQVASDIATSQINMLEIQ